MKERGEKKELRHDRHTVSLLTDHMVISPKYRGRVMVGKLLKNILQDKTENHDAEYYIQALYLSM